MAWPLWFVRFFHNVLRRILSIVTNVADSDIYITAFLTFLGKYIIFYMENYRLRKLKYHCLLITTLIFCGPEIEIEQTTRKSLQICTNNISNRETLTLFLYNKRVFKSWSISFSGPFRKATSWKNSTLLEFCWQVSSCRFVVQHQRQTTYVSHGMVVLDLCYPSPSTFPESCLPLTQSSASSSCNKHKCIVMHSQSLQLFGNNFPTSLRSGLFLLVWSRQGIILMLFSWHRKSHSNFHTRSFSEFPCFQILRFLYFTFIHPGI